MVLEGKAVAGVKITELALGIALECRSLAL